jgi:plasmid maintenance system antidote protein VapI
LSDLVNEKTSLSPEMAMRIELAFGVKADGMLHIQALWDAHEARRHAATLRVKRYRPEVA